MKKVILIWSFLIVTLSCKGQGRHFIEDDYRIRKYKNEIIEFLLEKNQLDYQGNDFKAETYLGTFEIKKCIEIYKNKFDKEDILLIRFNSLGSHADRYWAILENNKICFLGVNPSNQIKELELEAYDEGTIRLILLYVKRDINWYYGGA